MSSVLVAPSILAADWGRFGEEIKSVETAGAEWIHCDVMDGHFVPSITFGPDVVKAARRVTTKPLDVHLMIEYPERQLQSFADAGANNITVHVEVCKHLHRTVQAIHDLGITAGVALNPATAVSQLRDIIDYLDLVLVMTVNPGWGGQSFIPNSVSKIEEAAALIKSTGRKIWLQVDGGINEQTAPKARNAGADVMVAGTYIFASKDYKKSISALRS